MTLRKVIIAVALGISSMSLIGPPANASTGRHEVNLSADAAFDPDSVSEVSRSLCDKQVAMLGENGFHGDGKTIAFKVALIQRLVSKCHFNAVMFESSHYDFLAIARKVREGKPVTADMISSAIGGIWNHDEEMAPLIPFLLSQLKSGRVALGGLDDQLGSHGAFYSIEQMPTELTAYLQGPRRDECREALRKRIFYDYPATSPYSPEDQTRIQQCLRDMKVGIGATGGDPAARGEFLQMLANIERCVARDMEKGGERNSARDRSMYDNLLWLARRLPGHSKIIVWAANEHVAKDAHSSPVFSGGRNLGSYVYEAYGKRSFALGFSAAGGTFRWSSREARPIPSAPADSLEALGDASRSSRAARRHVGSERGQCGSILTNPALLSGPASHPALRSSAPWSSPITATKP